MDEYSKKFCSILNECDPGQNIFPLGGIKELVRVTEYVENVFVLRIPK